MTGTAGASGSSGQRFAGGEHGTEDSYQTAAYQGSTSRPDPCQVRLLPGAGEGPLRRSVAALELWRLRRKRRREVEAPYRPCLFCSGTGVRPHSRLNCTACKGKGVIPVKEPVETCPVCGGEGRDRRGDMQLYCAACGGAGVVTKQKAKAP